MSTCIIIKIITIKPNIAQTVHYKQLPLHIHTVITMNRRRHIITMQLSVMDTIITGKLVTAHTVQYIVTECRIRSVYLWPAQLLPPVVHYQPPSSTSTQ